jgi:poly-gamma-glutamate capsule biosynthesis protein CapA/YwtB (metallophosphatase superfamily)
MIVIKWILLLFICLMFFLMSSCKASAPPLEQSQQAIAEPLLPTVSETPPEEVPEIKPSEPPPAAEATLVAVGDIMMHRPQLPGAYNPETQTYDFRGFFQSVRSILVDANWTFGNLETPIAGDERGFRGYPLFNAPVALAEALADAGFDVLSTANNHSLDQGFTGLVHTLETLHSYGIQPIGTAAESAAATDIFISEQNGIKQAFLAYTYGTNGIPIPADKPYAVNLIQEERIAEDISKARALGADFVTVSLHFGNEYQRQPSEQQQTLARFCIDAGADLVLGHHPHVVQPYERYATTQADGSIREGVIIYSLGNFISNQFGQYKEFGLIFKVLLRKTYSLNGDSQTIIANVEAIPTWVHKYTLNGKKAYRILSLNDIVQSGDDPLLANETIQMLTLKREEMHEHISSMVIITEPDEMMP